MSEQNETLENNCSSNFTRYLTPIGVFALAFGSSLGWGSFILPGISFLPSAGTLGTVLGFIFGIIMMLIVIKNYDYLMNKFPDCGGTFTYTKNVFGYDHAFFSSWFLLLSYVSIIWANSSAITLLFRHLFGDTFKVGFLYLIGGQDIFLGEAALSIALLLVFGIICAYKKELAVKIQTIASFGMVFGILICFIAVIIQHLNGTSSYEPYFVPGGNPALQVFTISVMIPWAFIGLESVCHSSEEFKFSVDKSFKIMLIALLLGAASYIFLVIVAASILPQGYDNWFLYISDLNNLSGKAALPTLFAVNTSLGTFGITIFLITVCCAIITGLIGCYISAGRLMFSMAKEDLLPNFFGKLNSNHIPQNAILFIAVVSCIIPFCQRTAVGWIIDLTSFGASLAYAYSSGAAYSIAKKENNKTIKTCGILGIIVSVVFVIYLLIPNRPIAALAKESYLTITLWCLLGLLIFRISPVNNTKKVINITNSIWIFLLLLVMFTSQIWINLTSKFVSQKVVTNIDSNYVDVLRSYNINLSKEELYNIDSFLKNQINQIDNTIFTHGIQTLCFILIVLTIMFSIYKVVRKKREQEERVKEEIERINKIKIGFLFNMSHDIRTPMNAIIGYTTLAKDEKDISKIKEYLSKIDVSSQQMLSILNDVIEMSRIESHRKELVLSETNLNNAIDEVSDIFAGDMEAKQIKYTVKKENLTNPIVLCDKNCLCRVLFNILGNALKFTPEKGEITLTICQSDKEEKIGKYTISVKDNGIGISEEFFPKLFKAFEREKTSTESGLHGTGLGLSISKSIIDLMNGTIEVNSKKGQGSEFIIKIPLEIVQKQTEVKEAEKPADDKPDFSNMKLLLVEDIVINREIAKMLLGQLGFKIDCAENGKIAVDMYSNSKPGEYAAIIMDIQMPVMNGYEASVAIRSLENKEMANIPIIAMTANVLPEDIQKAKESGMNAHIAKPIDVANMTNTLVDILIKNRA